MDRGNLERTWKVRKKSGNSKINGYGSLQKMYLFCSKGEGCTFSLDSLSPSASSLGLLLKEEFAPLGSKFFPLRVAPKFEVKQLAPLK